MTLVYIPTLINVVVAIGIVLLTLVIAYYALITGRKQMDMGEEETKAQLFVERRM